MRRFSPLSLVAMVLIAAIGACEFDPVGPLKGGRELGRAEHGAQSTFSVMSRNVYLGAPLDPLFAPGVTAEDIPVLAAGVWSHVIANDFPTRAGALADEIAAERPAVVGLQEVSLFRIQTPGDLAGGGSVPATTVALDYLELLLDALDHRGLDYRVAVAVQNIDVELPMADPASPVGLSDIRMTDYDVILVRGDVDWSDPDGGNFSAELPLEVGPIPLSVPRGWTSVVVDVGDASLRVVNTHPEAFHDGIRDLQTQEILLLLAGESLPVILMGDLNTRPNGSGYGILAGAGFEDAWTSSAKGYTCCHDADLGNATSALFERIDYVLLRGEFPFVAEAGFRGSVHASLVGDQPPDRTDSGLWPSDHAGVVATLRFDPTR